MQVSTHKALKENILVYIISFVLLLPVFFINYRILAFNTLPFDDYYSFILDMDGKLDSFSFSSPQGYRFLFYSFGYIFYKILPFVELSQLEQHASGFHYYKALQALSFVSFFCLHHYFFLCYLLVKNRISPSPVLSLATAFVCLVLSFQVYFFAIDALYLFYVTLMIYYLNKPGIFIPLMLFSFLANEKICILFLLFFLVNQVTGNKMRSNKTYLFFSLLTLILYLVEKKILGFPGYDYQTDLSLFWTRITISLPYIFSIKGFYLNLVPLIILTLISWTAWKSDYFSADKTAIHHSVSILILPYLFFILGMFACSDYSIGRVSFHTFPFFIVPLAFLIDKFNLKSGQSEITFKGDVN